MLVYIGVKGQSIAIFQKVQLWAEQTGVFWSKAKISGGSQEMPYLYDKNDATDKDKIRPSNAWTKIDKTQKR